MSEPGKIGQATMAVWAGETGHAPYERATQVPVVHSVSFGYHDLDTWRDVALGRQQGHIYSRRAANLGCVETVVGPPVVTSHVECSDEERRAAGIPEGLVRYSTGIEDMADLIGDLDQALANLR